MQRKVIQCIGERKIMWFIRGGGEKVEWWRESSCVETVVCGEEGEGEEVRKGVKCVCVAGGGG